MQRPLKFFAALAALAILVILGILAGAGAFSSGPETVSPAARQAFPTAQPLPPDMQRPSVDTQPPFPTTQPFSANAQQFSVTSPPSSGAAQAPPPAVPPPSIKTQPPPAAADVPEQSVADLGAELAEKYKNRIPAQWGEHLPGIVRTVDGTPVPRNPHKGEAPRTLALTLDACDGPTDKRIIALLREHKVPATIFVTNRWLRQNQAVAADLAADSLFELACHGKRHKPASVNGRQIYGINGTRNIPALVEEVEDNARAVAAVTGTRPRWYRSGTAYYDDVALEIIHDLGLAVAGYAVSADQGATLPANAVRKLLLGAPDKGIILCHLNHPKSGTYQGLALAVPALLGQGAAFVHLSGVETLSKPVGDSGALPRTPQGPSGP